MVSIIEVKTKKQLRCFVDYPNQLYRDVEQFVPATYGDDLEDWDRSKNPAFAYCDARCWLAYRDGEVVGRIGAILSRKANEKWGTNRLRFTQVDFIDDPEVSRALFATVENWAREIGCTAVHGPLGFTDMDREGMLIDGFDRRGCFFTYYNFPYYKEHMAALGYVKDVDWIENLISVPTDERIFQRWEKIANYVLRHHHLHVYEVHNRLGYLPLLKRFFKLVNIAYAPLYGTVELSEEQIRKYSMKFAPLINPKLTCFVMDENNELVAFGVAAPSIAEALKKLVTWILTTALLVFTIYLSIVRIISGSADSATVKVAKAAISGVVPVVGGIIADASETVLAGAGMLKNTIGVFGMLAILAACAYPFLQLGVQYLLYKLTAYLASVVGAPGLCKLIDGLGGAFGLILGMTGGCALLLLISVLSSVGAVMP